VAPAVLKIPRRLSETWRRRGGAGSAASSIAAALALLAAVTVVMTWPQVPRLATHAADHHDVYFNMWRLTWMAHALASAPASFFDGNIFYPEPRALTFSDAMPFEGFLAAPLLWAGLPRVLVHNLMLLGGIMASGIGVFVLAWRLTASATAAFVAAIIFAFAPYRFDHYMHMELQWAVWTPLAFWAVHRTIESGRWVHGLQAGAFVALQMLSSVYYGIFLGIVLAIAGGFLLLGLKPRRAVRAAAALGAGGALAALLCAVYAQPYLETKSTVSGRPTAEITRYSARVSDYLRATPDNWMYGEGEADLGLSERRLFPGLAALALAIIGLLVRRPTRIALTYLVVLLVAVELSLGFRGYSYRFLYEHSSIFGGLRAPARFGIVVLMCVAVLAAYGYAALQGSLSGSARRVLAALVPCAILLEYRVNPLPLVRYDNRAPPIYALLASLPPGVVAEFPMPTTGVLPGPDAFYSYMSTFHWRPLVNGYSGFYPSSYMRRLTDVQGFPDIRSIAGLRHSGVAYVIVHLSLYKQAESAGILAELALLGEFRYLGHLSDGRGTAVIYRLQ
jgi:hypothetical protein